MDEEQKAALIKEAEADAAAYLKGATPTVKAAATAEQDEGYTLPKEIADVYAALRNAEKDAKVDENGSLMPSPETAAMLGAGAGAYAQHTGRTLGNGLLRPGEGVYSAPAPPVAPVVAPAASAPPAGPSLVDTQIAAVTERQRLVDDALNANLRRITGDPKANYAGFSEEQINRLFSGGNSDTLNTPGTSREYTHNDESSRKADVTSLNRDRLGLVGLDPRVAVEQAGPLVTLADSRIAVPPQVAVGLNQNNQARAAAEAERLRQEHARQTQINESTLAALNAKKQADTETAERSAANKAIADQEAAMRAHSAAQRGQRNAGLRAGAGKVGLGALGGAEAGAQAVNMYNNYRAGVNPDWTEKLSLAGGLASMFGGPVLGVLGQAAQIPYAVKHREEIARAMRMRDVMPDTMQILMGQGEGEEPAFSALQKP